MKFSIGCTSCKSDVIIDSSARSKQELKDKVGDQVSSHCAKCGSANSAHVNRVYAEPGKKELLIAGVMTLAGILLSGLMWFYVGFAAVVAVTPGVIYYIAKKKEASDFNRMMLRRR